MYENFEVSRVLVIAPLKVAEDTWSRETEKWDHLNDLRISKVLGSEPERRKALKADADIYVINRENVQWLIEHPDAYGKRWPFDMVVIDELSSFKSSSSKRFKSLRKVRPLIDRIVGLTGTPAANGLMDLWAEIYLLDRGERLGPTITGYRQAYFTPAWGNGVVIYKWKAKDHSMERIQKKISDITVSMKAKDYLELPERIDVVRGVHLSIEAMRKYREMEKESLIEALDGETIAALNAAAVMGKLQQLANGFCYDEDHGVHWFSKDKLDALREIAEEAGSPVLVFYQFEADRDLILSEIEGSRQLKTEKDICDWNAGKIPMLIAHPASVGYGLNLQEGGHIIVWYGLPWSLELYQQANARLHRQGQTMPVRIYHLVAEGTVDTEIKKALEQKDTTQQTLINMLKAKRKEYEEQ